MSVNQFGAAWRELRGGLKAQWGKVTGDADAFLTGRREADIAHMQRRYGLTHTEARYAREYLREPGVLDDWNDDRSILGL